jgi:hypothetical protein
VYRREGKETVLSGEEGDAAEETVAYEKEEGIVLSRGEGETEVSRVSGGGQDVVVSGG